MPQEVASTNVTHCGISQCRMYQSVQSVGNTVPLRGQGLLLAGSVLLNNTQGLFKIIRRTELFSFFTRRVNGNKAAHVFICSSVHLIFKKGTNNLQSIMSFQQFTRKPLLNTKH